MRTEGTERERERGFRGMEGRRAEGSGGRVKVEKEKETRRSGVGDESIKSNHITRPSQAAVHFFKVGEDAGDYEATLTEGDASNQM